MQTWVERQPQPNSTRFVDASRHDVPLHVHLITSAIEKVACDTKDAIGR